MEDSSNGEKTGKWSRKVVIHKTDTGFGFDVRGQITEGGELKCINGEFYPPLQQVSAVIEGGPAENAGLKKWDRILEINGKNAEGAAHQQVLDLIKSSDDMLTLTVISFTPEEAERLKEYDDLSCYSYNDYSDVLTAPITIPHYGEVKENGEEFVTYNIHMGGRYLCSRRFKEFYVLELNLKNEFPDFESPLDMSWERSPFDLPPEDTNNRRKRLERYLQRVSAVRIIAEHEIMQRFLSGVDDENVFVSEGVVELKVFLPDRTIVVVHISKSSSVEEVYEAVVDKIGMPKYVWKIFALFEISEYGFERMLRPNELPHILYMQNYSTGASTCLLIRKWLFTLKVEIVASRDNMASAFFYWQAIDDVNKGHIKPKSEMCKLKTLQDFSRKSEFLNMVRLLEGYGEISFPRCRCETVIETDVIATLGFRNLKLYTFNDDGTVDSNAMEFAWEHIIQWTVEMNPKTFIFWYNQTDGEAKTIKIFTSYCTFMIDCFRRIVGERKRVYLLSQQNKVVL